MPARWRIESDQPRMELMPGGSFEPHREIRFQEIDTGSRGEILVPLRNYSPEFVAAEIQRQADMIVAVRAMQTG